MVSGVGQPVQASFLRVLGHEQLDQVLLSESRERPGDVGDLNLAIQAGLDLGISRGVLMVHTTSYDKNPGDSLVGYAGLAFC